MEKIAWVMSNVVAWGLGKSVLLVGVVASQVRLFAGIKLRSYEMGRVLRNGCVCVPH